MDDRGHIVCAAVCIGKEEILETLRSYL
jgi:hypothetical protein